MKVFVELDAQPAVDAFNGELSRGRGTAMRAAKAAEATTNRKADSVLADLRGRGPEARELFRTSNAVPGLAVAADAAALRQLASRNRDVRSITPLVPKSANNASAVQLTQALATWEQAGFLGDGVRIGIIDSGIDYTHAHFGGPGTPAAFAAIDSTKVDPAFFPTAKVVGGYDFVGDRYDAGSTDPTVSTPVPDPNPLDCSGHGTHVAGSAAGFGVDADGSTFAGDYRNLTAGVLNGMRVGPGTAPKASLYALRVFGCDGGTSVAAEAMDWALDPNQDGDFGDHLDIVNLSLGSRYTAVDDPENLFVRKIMQNGVLPVITAGNGGDHYDVGGSPGNSPEALTVASSRDSFILRDAVQVTAPGGVTGPKPGRYGGAFPGLDALDRTAPVAALEAGNADGCLPISAADAAAAAGKFLWMEFNEDHDTRRCGTAEPTANARAAGAVGVVLASSLDDFRFTNSDGTDLPWFKLTASASGELRPALAAGTLTMRMAGELRDSLKTFLPGIEETVSDFTSRGPRAPGVKPDVSAPGDTIVSALIGSGSEGFSDSGTSMAAPHVAGIAALVRQAHPSWTAAELKAAVMGTANHDIHSEAGPGGPLTAPNRVGVGRVDSRAAVANEVLASVDDPTVPVSVGFGVVEVGAPMARTKTVNLVNKGGSAATYNVAYQPITEIPGVFFDVAPASVSVPAHGSATLSVTLRVDDLTALRKTADPTIDKVQFGAARQFLADASGRLALTPTAGATVPLRVAVYAAPKPVGDIEAPAGVVFPAGAKQAALALTGRALDQGAGDQRYQSLVSVLELHGGEDPQLPRCGPGVVDFCAPNDQAAGGDIRFVGAMTDAPQVKADGGGADKMLVGFGVATWSNWNRLAHSPVPTVFIDVDNDGTFDFQTFVEPYQGSDILLSTTKNLQTDAVVGIQPLNGRLGEVDTNVFDSNVVVLPVSLAALGIDPAASSARLSYVVAVEGYDGRFPNGWVDISAQLSFDPLKPGLWLEGPAGRDVIQPAIPGTPIVVHRDAAALALDDSDAALVLHFHNPSGRRASWVSLKDARQSLPGVVAESVNWGLRGSLTTGAADTTFTFGARTTALVPLAGDWDGDGVMTPGYFQGGKFSLRNTNAAGAVDTTFTFGDPRGFPVAGDFDRDGLDDVVVFRNGSWLLRTASDGHEYGPYVFGAGAWPSVVPVVGDWDGDGVDGIGYYCRDSVVCPAGTWNLLQNLWDDPATASTFDYNPGASPYPVVGDWDADGRDTVGVKSMTTPSTWRLNNQNDGSAAEITFDFGTANDLAVAWARPPVAP